MFRYNKQFCVNYSEKLLSLQISQEDEGLKKYKILQTIGQGSYSTVQLAINTKSSELCVLKIIYIKQLKTKQDKNTLDREIYAYNAIKAFNTQAKQAQLKSYLIDQKELYQDDKATTLVQNYAYLGDLRHIMKRFKQIPYKFVVKIIKQICLGLRQLHSLGIVHRDVKPENILFDRMCNVIITDFGTSKQVQKEELPLMTGQASYKTANIQQYKQSNEDNIKAEFATMSLVGTLSYFAPEQYKTACEFLFPIDIYAIGCITFELLTGNTYNLTNKQTKEQLYKNLPQEAIDFIRKTTDKNPRIRFDGGYNKLLNMPFLKDVDPTEQLVDPLIIKHILNSNQFDAQFPIRESSLIANDSNFDYYLLRHELIEHFLINADILYNNQHFIADICVTNFNKFVIIDKQKKTCILQFYLTYQDFEINKINKKYEIKFKQTVQNQTINTFNKLIFLTCNSSVQNFITNVNALFTSQIFDFCQYCQAYTISNNMCNTCGRIKYQEQSGIIKKLTIQQNYFLTKNNEKLQSLLDENLSYQCNISVYLQRKNRVHFNYQSINYIQENINNYQNLNNLLQLAIKKFVQKNNIPDAVELNYQQHEIRALLAHIYQISLRQLDSMIQYKTLPRINQFFFQGKFSSQVTQFYDFLTAGCLNLEYENKDNKEIEEKLLQNVDYNNSQQYISYQQLCQNQELQDYLEQYYEI